MPACKALRQAVDILKASNLLQGGSAPPEKPAKKRTATAAPSAIDRIPVLKVLQVLLPIIVAGLAYLIFFSGESSK